MISYVLLAVLVLMLVFFLYEPLGLRQYNPFAEGVSTGYPRMMCPRFTNYNPSTGNCDLAIDTRMVSGSMVARANSPWKAGQLFGY